MGDAALHVFLVRHGVTDWNEQGRLMGWSDIGLNARGQAQAAAVAEALRAVPLGTVHASPQRRAQETAAAIAAAHGLTVQSEADLAEVRIEKWIGQTWAEVRDDPDIQRYIADPLYECAAIEPAARVHQRMAGLLARLHAATPAGAIALVSHGDPLRLLVTAHLGGELAAYRRLRIDTGSISVLRFDALGPQLVLLNWRPGADPLDVARRG
jgi:broad specificity phosphatase PhoE